MPEPNHPPITKPKKRVPVLVTWDVDPDLWRSVEQRRWAVQQAAELCKPHAIPATFFFTAKPIDDYKNCLEDLMAQGHEVGCHGWTHGDEENYDRMPAEQQLLYIKEATQKLNAAAGVPIRSFRGPRVKTSGLTLKILSDHGYTVDSSVCSQRLDGVSSNLINLNWLSAPRRAYHPRASSAFKAGSLPIWEVPVSALVLPYISSTLQVLGIGAAKLIFRLLYAESRRTQKPIVYLAHPVEFTTSAVRRRSFKERWSRNMRPEYFTISYIRANGLRIRKILFTMDADTLRIKTQELFSYMASFSDVTFMAVSEYAKTLPNTR